MQLILGTGYKRVYKSAGVTKPVAMLVHVCVACSLNKLHSYIANNTNWIDILFPCVSETTLHYTNVHIDDCS